MNLQDFFAGLHLDSSGILARFGNNEALLEKFLKRFPSDPNWPLLEKAVKEKNFEDANIAAHTLKGLCLNLGLTSLAELFQSICLDARQKDGTLLEQDFTLAEQEYQDIVAQISLL